jgi:group I intron endonuclease
MRIYIAFNNVNGKMYVGQTIHSVAARWKQHCSRKRGSALANAIQKYGAEAFSVFEVAHADTLEELNRLEERIISDLNTLSPNGYNLRSGGENKLHSSISREKMSRVQRAAYKENWGDGKYPNSGKTFSIESRKKMSASHLGHKQTLEQIEKRRKKLMKPVRSSTGEVFASIGSAARYFGILHQQVSRLVRNGKTTKSGLGFEFVRETPFVS